MEFNEKTALDIIQKYNLAPKTLNVWKSRNSIPDRYGNSDFVLDYSDYVSDCANLREICALPVVNKASFDVHFGYLRAGAEFAKGKIGIRESVYALVKSEIEKMRHEVEKCLIIDLKGLNFTNQLAKTLKVGCLKHTVLLKNAFGINEVNILLYHIEQKNEFDLKTLAKIRKCLKDFYTKIDKVL